MPQQGDSRPTTETSAPSAAPRGLLRALDWLRGIAVLVMVESRPAHLWLCTTAAVVRWRAKNLQRRAAVRIMPVK